MLPSTAFLCIAAYNTSLLHLDSFDFGLGNSLELGLSQYCLCQNYYWMNSGKGGSNLYLETLLLELIAFRLIPVICSARRAKSENYGIQQFIPDSAYPAIKSVKFQELMLAQFPDPLYFGPDRTFWIVQLSWHVRVGRRLPASCQRHIPMPTRAILGILFIELSCASQHVCFNCRVEYIEDWALPSSQRSAHIDSKYSAWQPKHASTPTLKMGQHAQHDHWSNHLLSRIWFS